MFRVSIRCGSCDGLIVLFFGLNLSPLQRQCGIQNPMVHEPLPSTRSFYKRYTFSNFSVFSIVINWIFLSWLLMFETRV